MNTLLSDLKPDNVVLSASNVAKLTDFGCGRFGIKPARDIIAGTAGYVAPEVLLEEEYSFSAALSADLFSLGVLTWALFSGGLLKKKMKADPPTLHLTIRSGLFRDLENDYRELQKCLDLRLVKVAFRIQDYPRKIRAHPLLTQLDMPSFEAPPARVNQWLEQWQKLPVSHRG
eukprot:Skav207563  [mRNA]  locus=scaffold3235:196400:201337:- [translate_table: standard]